MTDFLIIDINSMPSFCKGMGPIILVDDDESLILLVKQCYKKSKRENELICIQNGDDMMKLIDKVYKGQSEMPEVILLDINMPKKNGFDILKEIRAYPDFKETPIIVMFTSSDSTLDMEKAKELSANAFFSKPSKIEDYVSFFKQL